MSMKNDGSCPDASAFVEQQWRSQAFLKGFDLTDYDAAAPLEARIAWAKGKGLLVAAILTRYSTDGQDSTDQQLRRIVDFSVGAKIYPAPEYVCVDEGITGRKSRRPGLERLRKLLKGRNVEVVLIFNMSRLSRSLHKSVRFMHEEVVDRGLRAIAVSQGIDTADKNGKWQMICTVHGLIDEMMLSSTAEHVRAGLAHNFMGGRVVGALTVGFRAEKVFGPSGESYNVPVIDEAAAKLVKQHFEWVRDGMSLKEGWRRWVAAGGPCDPRSGQKRMSYKAYRRMLSNGAYRGDWTYGKKRTQWNHSADYAKQIDAAPGDVRSQQREHLRIVSDELFYAVQQQIAKCRNWSGPKRKSCYRLSDLVAGCFYCEACAIRFCHASGGGGAMTCKNEQLCPRRATIQRQRAVESVLQLLGGLLAEDAELIDQIMALLSAIDNAPDLRERLAEVERQILKRSNQLEDLLAMAGEGSPEDRAARNAKTKAAEAERCTLRQERDRLRSVIDGASRVVTREEVTAWLREIGALLEAGVAGRLGQDTVHSAAAAFRQLVGGRVIVRVIDRPGRKRMNVLGLFTPGLLSAAAAHFAKPLSPSPAAETQPVGEMQVWLRPLAKADQFAEICYELIDVQGLSYRAAAKVLQAQGERFGDGEIWQFRARYYEMIGQEPPPRPYNNGNPRKGRE